MHDHRFEQALQALRTSQVEPVLLPDDLLQAPRRSPRLVLTLGTIFIAVGAIAFGVMWNGAEGITQRLLTPMPSTKINPQQRVKATADTVVSDVQTVSSVAHVNVLDDELLVVDLTPDELRAFGIAIHEGGARVTTERLLVAGQYYSSMADALRVIGITKDDSLALIRASVDITADTVFGERLLGRADLATSDHLSVLTCRRDVVSHASEFDAFFSAILDDSLMNNFVYWSTDSVMDRIIPDVTDGLVEVRGKRWSDRSRRPVVWCYRFPGSDRMLLAFFLPTMGLRQMLPARYRADFDRVYGRFLPRVPTTVRVPEIWKPEWERPLVVLAAEQAGLTAIEPGADDLWRLGITVGLDSIAIATASLSPRYRYGELVSVGDTITMVSTSYRPFVVDSINPSASFTYPDTVRVVQHGTSGKSWDFEMPEASSYRVMGADGRPRLGSMGSSGTTVQSLDTTWRKRYPFFSAMAFRVAYELSTTFLSIDSLLRYEVVVDDVRIPVTKILVPVRVVGPYGHRNDGDTCPARADAVFWYAPSDRFFASLPERVRGFVIDEYNAIAQILEDHLSARDLCSLLDKPSALGLCSIGDTVLRLDGVGPIPARDVMTIFLRSAKATKANISVVDDAGRTVLERTSVPVESGNNQLQLDLSTATIVRGAYTVVVRTDVGMRTSRVLVER